MTAPRVFAVVAALVFSVTIPARAAENDSAKARELYQKATAHYGVGEFEAAAEAYQEAYKLKPDPALLFNAAQSFRLAGKLDKALLLYKNYGRLYPDAKNAAEVRVRVDKLEAQIAAEKAAATAPPPASASPAGAAPTPLPSVAPAAASLAPVISDSASSDERPLTRKPWFWIAVGGAVVVTAGVLAIALGGSESPWANVMEVQQAQGGVR